MNKTQLEYFVSVAELHSFTKAAQRHFVSQTAVTQQIQNLEENLHTKLFDRSKRPVQMTDEGTAFLTDAKAILERMYEAAAKMAIVSNSAAGALRIGYTKGYERSGLSGALRRYHRAYPNVFITCHRCNSRQMAEALLANELDVIFTWSYDAVVTAPQLRCQEVENSSLDVVLYHAHPLAYRPYLKREDLRGESFVYLAPSGTISDDAYLRLYREAGFDPDIVFYTDDIDSILMMVAAEEGITIMPSYITQKLYSMEGLVRIPLRGQKESASIVAVWNAQKRNPLLENFLPYLSK